MESPSTSTRAVNPSDETGLRVRTPEDERRVFESLVRVNWDLVMRFCWKRVSFHEAEELTVDVFASAYRSLRRAKSPGLNDLVGWQRYLLSCARNRVIDHWRRRGVHPPAAGLEELIGDEGIAANASSPPERRVPAEHGLSHDRSHAIRECMNRLDVLSRATCWLVFVEDRSKREVARVLGKAESSVRALLVEALESLRHCLAQKGLAPAM